MSFSPCFLSKSVFFFLKTTCHVQSACFLIKVSEKHFRSKKVIFLKFISLLRTTNQSLASRYQLVDFNFRSIFPGNKENQYA